MNGTEVGSAGAWGNDRLTAVWCESSCDKESLLVGSKIGNSPWRWPESWQVEIGKIEEMSKTGKVEKATVCWGTGRKPLWFCIKQYIQRRNA